MCLLDIQAEAESAAQRSDGAEDTDMSLGNRRYLRSCDLRISRGGVASGAKSSKFQNHCIRSSGGVMGYLFISTEIITGI